MASSDFDWDGFLGKRASRGGGLQELAALAGQDAALRVDQISNDLALAKSAVLKAKQREQRDSGSWVSNLGLTPGTTEANVVNVAASLASGASRVGGFVSSLGPNIGAIVDEYQASDADYAAYARYQKGTPTREDQLRLNRSVTQVNHGREGSLLQSMPAQDDGDTILSRIQRAENRRQLAADITARFDNSGIVHQGNRDEMNAQLKDGFDKPWQQAKDGWNNGDLGDIGAGLGKLVLNVGQAAIDHPMAATEYIAENVPQLALGAFGKVGKAALTADNMGYGADMYTKGITEYQRTHKGAMPGVEHRKYMGSHAVGAVVAEQAMDLSLLKGMGIGEEIAGVTAKSFKKTLLDAAKTVGKGLGGESLTEGVQTYAEGEAGNKPAKAVDIYVGSAIGGMSGGGMASVKPAVDVLAAAGKALIPTNLGKAPVEHSELFKKAVAEGNPDLFLDPDQENYDPKQALSVLQKMASAASTSAEDKANYQAKAQGVLESVDTQIAALRSMTDEGIAANKQKLDSVTAQITKAEADGNAPRAAALKKMAGILQKQIDDSAAVTPEEKAAREASIKELTKTRDEASKIYDLIVDESAASQVKDLDVQATLAEANAAVDPAVPESATKSAAAVKKLMVLSMVSPDALSGADAQGLVSNTANGLSTQERSYLTAYATAAHAIATLKSMPKVSKEIFDGDPALNQKGILTYQQNVGKFLSVGDMASAERELKGLANFLAGHKSKSTVMAEAWAKFKTTKQPLTVIKDATGKWSIPGAGMKVMALHTNTIGADSTKLVANVRIEAQAIEETLKSLQAARDLVKSQKTKPTQQTTATVAPTNVQASPAQQPADVGVAPPQEAVNTETQEAAPQTVEPAAAEAVQATVVSLSGEVAKLEKERRKIARENPRSLYSALKNALGDADLNDIYGSEWKKRFTSLKGKQSRRLIDIIEDGTLDDFLPPNLRFGLGIEQGLDQAQEAEEYIKQRLRERDYITEDTKLSLVQIDLTIEQLEQTLTEEDIQNEFDQASADLQYEQEGSSEKAAPADPEAEAGSTASDEGSQRHPQADEQVTEAEENTAPVEAKLNVLVNAAEDSVLAKWLKQSGKAAVSAGSRPLTSVKDFMSAWKKGEISPQEFLKDASLTEEQIKTLNFFRDTFIGNPAKKVKGWSDVLRSMVPLKFNEEFNYEKVAQYFIEKIDGRNDFEENIKAAMVMAGLTWTNDTYANQGVDHDKQINQILNRDEKTEVSKEERAMLPQGIVRRAQAADSIGRAIVQALGLKADKDASASFMPKLEAALGMYALDLLMEQGVVQEHRISNASFQKVLGSEVAEDAEGKDQVFVRLAVSKQGSFGKPVMSIVENMRGSKNVLEKLFSVEPRGMAPTFEPVPFNIKRAKGSRMGVPKWLAEILDKKNHEENFVEPSMLNVFHAILGEGDEGMSTMLQIAGAKVVDKYTHISNIKGIEAKAAGLRRELVNFLGFVKDGIGMQDGGLDTPFFLQHEPWNQQRVGILNGLVNPQNSKIVRYGIFRKSWEAGVDTSNTEQMDKFKLRVMEGLGVKTDKQGNEASLAQWASKVENNEVIQAGVAVMVQAQKLQPLSAEQRQTLLAAVKAGGEDMHTLHVLAELAKMASAVDGKFTSRLVGEIDGVTNGPMFSSLLLGAAYDVDKFFKGFLNKGGFFEEGSGHKDYNVYRGGAGVLDLYETVASKIINAIPPQAQWTNQIKSVFFFTGELAKDGKVASAGRNIVKRPVTALNFGSSTWKAVDGMAEDFIDNIYKAIEKVAREDGKGKEELIAHINTVVGDSRNQWNPHMTVQAMLSTEFDDWAIRGIKKTFNEVIGETAKDTLEMAFYDLLARRDSINSTASVAFGLYDTAYKALEKGYIEYLTKQEGVELDAKGNLKWDLTPGQQKRLDAILSKMQPVVHTLMSLRSGKAGLSSGLSVAKVGQALSQKPSYKAATSIYSAKDGGHKNRSLSAIGDVFKHPGVSAFSKQIHSFDSGVSHQSVGKSEALNNHDANTIGFMGMDATAVNLNEATWDGLLEYSPANEMFMALARTVQGLADLLSDPELSPDMAPAIKGYLESSIKTWSEDTKVDFEGTPTEFLKMLLNNAKQTAFAADTIRLGVASKMETVNQYALEGGGYQVKPEQRKQAEQMLASLTKDLTPEVVQAMATIAQVLEGSTATKTESGYMGSPKKTVAEVLKQPDAQTQRLITVLASLETVPEPMRELLAKVNEALAQGEADLDTAISKSLSPNEQAVVLQFLASQRDAGISTPFGNIGPSSIESDPAVAAIFEATPEISGKALMRKLKGILTQRSGGNNAFLLKLMPDLYKALDSVAVHYVTPLTMPADVLATPETASRGWTLVDGTDLYVLSPEFANSGLDVELLLHELTHTALQQRLDNPASPEQEQAVAELNDLLAAAKAYVKSHFSSSVEMNSAVSSIHELVSWGMYNQKFQTEVLRKVSVKTPQGFVGGMKQFIDSLLGLLGMETKTSQEDTVDGFTALLVNASLVTQAKADANARQIKKRVGEVLSMVSPTPEQQIDNYTTEAVFAALSGQGNSLPFTEKLQGILADVVTKLHGPFGLIKTQIERTVGKTVQDTWAHAQATGQRVFAAKVLASGMRFSQQEAYVAEQVEAVVRIALENKAAANSQIYNELEKLYTQARSTLKGKIDPDVYAFVFYPQKREGDTNKSDYLSVFAAMALSNEEFNKALSFETHRPELSLNGMTFMERIGQMWRDFSDLVGAMMTGTRMGQQANSKVKHLVNQLVQIEARNKHAIKSSKPLFELMAPVGAAGKTMIGVAKDAATKVVESAWVKENKNGFIRLAGAVGSITVNDRIGTVVEGLNAMRDATEKLSAGEIMSMVNYVKGIPQWTNKLLLMGKQVGKNRLAVINDTAKAVLHAFKNQGKDLTEADKTAVSAVLLRPGLFVLEKSHGVSGIQQMLENAAALQSAIDAELAKIQGLPEFEHYVLQAKGLAWYRVTEEVGIQQQMFNAGNIARMFGTGKPAPATATQAEPVIEQLVALYAMQYADAKHKKAVIELMRSEANRGPENGIEMVLKMQQYQDTEARAKLFQGSEALMMHGFTPEILNPHTTFEVARSVDEEMELEDLGYVRLPKHVPLDPADPDQREATMYVLTGGGMGRRTTGLFSYTGMAAKGKAKHDNFYSPNHAQGVSNMQSMTSIYGQHEAGANAQVTGALAFDPRKVTKKINYMAPIVNAQGQVVDYRYMMKGKTKDTILQRDNRFEHILGVMAGATYDKPASREQNKRAVEALRAHYEATSGDNPDGFITVHSSSSDPRMREAWDLLPDGTKQDIRAVWGAGGMKVPKRMVDVLFGYRKASLADAFDKEDQNGVEKYMVAAVSSMLRTYARTSLKMTADQAERYSRRGAVVMRRFEAAWQEVVHVVKDMIVVKSGTVLIGNILSNGGMLAMKGVPFFQGMKHQLTALRGAMDYERDRGALAQLKALQQVGYGSRDVKEIQAEVVRLEDSLARNPIKQLIDSGLMPTIVEDIAMEEDLYSYKSQWSGWVDDKLSGINPHVKTVGRTLYMAHDTSMYKFLSKTTQYSDFVGRYALYMHLTQRKDGALSHDDAVFEASETFVNYDNPLPKHMQYLDDMGFMPFIKYFFSIQRVLVKNLKDDPLRVLSVLSLGHFLGNLPMPTDSSFLARIGNNFMDIGALGIGGAVSEMMTAQSAMAIIQ